MFFYNERWKHLLKHCFWSVVSKYFCWRLVWLYYSPVLGLFHSISKKFCSTRFYSRSPYIFLLHRLHKIRLTRLVSPAGHWFFEMSDCKKYIFTLMIMIMIIILWRTQTGSILLTTSFKGRDNIWLKAKKKKIIFKGTFQIFEPNSNQISTLSQWFLVLQSECRIFGSIKTKWKSGLNKGNGEIHQ